MLTGRHQLFVVALVLAYVCALIVLHQHPRWDARMSFYGCGLEMPGRLGTMARRAARADAIVFFRLTSLLTSG